MKENGPLLSGLHKKGLKTNEEVRGRMIGDPLTAAIAYLPRRSALFLSEAPTYWLLDTRVEGGEGGVAQPQEAAQSLFFFHMRGREQPQGCNCAEHLGAINVYMQRPKFARTTFSSRVERKRTV